MQPTGQPGHRNLKQSPELFRQNDNDMMTRGALAVIIKEGNRNAILARWRLM